MRKYPPARLFGRPGAGLCGSRRILMASRWKWPAGLCPGIPGARSLRREGLLEPHRDQLLDRRHRKCSSILKRKAPTRLSNPWAHFRVAETEPPSEGGSTACAPLTQLSRRNERHSRPQAEDSKPPADDRALQIGSSLLEPGHALSSVPAGHWRTVTSSSLADRPGSAPPRLSRSAAPHITQLCGYCAGQRPMGRMPIDVVVSASNWFVRHVGFAASPSWSSRARVPPSLRSAAMTTYPLVRGSPHPTGPHHRAYRPPASGSAHTLLCGLALL